MKDICYIVGAGECEKLYINEDNKAYLIAADGGMKYLEAAGLMADMVIGDFDSLKFVPKHDNVVVLPTEKDDTDMYAAVSQGMLKGYKKFIIYGGMGGRFDHSMANCQLLNYIAESGCIGFIVEKDYSVTCIHNGNVSFSDEFIGTLSVFSSGTASKGVSIKGFKYEMINGELTSNHPLGVSNEFLKKEGNIEVKDGTLLIIFETNPKQVCDGIGTDIVFGGFENE